MKKTLKPIQFFVPITRVDEEQRTVEGLAFVNEVVEGEGGLRLKRTAMEAATPDYMTWGAIRAMHQPIAAGSAQAVEWLADGAHIRAKIVDDGEWKKCLERVYKGFSVGVAATVMRGNDVESCRWIETSLVDRPKDPGAVFTCVRADDVAEEYEVDVIEERADGPIDFNSSMAASDLWEEGYEAMDALWSVLCDICYSDSDDKDGLARTSIQQFADFIAPMVAGGQVAARAEGTGDGGRGTVMLPIRARAAVVPETVEVPDPPAPAAVPDEATIGRIAALEAAIERESARVPGLLTRLEAAEGLIERMKQTPAIKPPVRYLQGLERTFVEPIEGDAGDVEKTLAALDAEYKRLSETTPASEPDEQKRLAVIHRMGQIKAAIYSLRQQG